MIDGYTADDAVRKVPLTFLPCHGGPNDGRFVAFPVDPAGAHEVGSMTVFVTGFEPYVHTGISDEDAKAEKPAAEATPQLLAPQGSTRFVIASQDLKRMGIEEFSVYGLESDSGTHRLAFQGLVELLEYGRFLRLDPSVALPGKEKPSDLVEIATSDGGVRRLQVFQTPCVGGPADGKTYPLLIRPDVLWENGLTTVAVSEFGFRPKEHTISFRREEPATNFIGHLSLYVLEELRTQPYSLGRRTGFQLKFHVSLDAKSYLSVHHPTKEQKP